MILPISAFVLISILIWRNYSSPSPAGVERPMKGQFPKCAHSNIRLYCGRPAMRVPRSFKMIPSEAKSLISREVGSFWSWGGDQTWQRGTVANVRLQRNSFEYSSVGWPLYSTGHCCFPGVRRRISRAPSSSPPPTRCCAPPPSPAAASRGRWWGKRTPAVVVQWCRELSLQEPFAKLATTGLLKALESTVWPISGCYLRRSYAGQWLMFVVSSTCRHQRCSKSKKTDLRSRSRSLNFHLI